MWSGFAHQKILLIHDTIRVLNVFKKMDNILNYLSKKNNSHIYTNLHLYNYIQFNNSSNKCHAEYEFSYVLRHYLFFYEKTLF